MADGATRRSGNPAVMASTGGLKDQRDDEATAHHRRLGYFPTPPWAARAGAEVIHAVSGLRIARQTCWEPACGEGHMVHGLRDHFGHVAGSDVRDYGAGFEVRDFLLPEHGLARDFDWIVTNPPFTLAERFVERGLEIASEGVAILARLSFLESAGRYDLMRRLTVLAPFSGRVPMTLGRWDPAVATATAYAWFIWSKVSWETGRIAMIPPGTRARLSRESDLEMAWKGETGGRHSPPSLGPRERDHHITRPSGDLLAAIGDDDKAAP